MGDLEKRIKKLEAEAVANVRTLEVVLEALQSVKSITGHHQNLITMLGKHLGLVSPEQAAEVSEEVPNAEG